MAEPRRVPLLAVKASGSNEKLPSSKVQDKDDGNASVDKQSAKIQKSVRLEISLSTSNEKHCPEYSYPKLIKDKLVSFHCVNAFWKSFLMQGRWPMRNSSLIKFFLGFKYIKKITKYPSISLYHSFFIR